MTTVTAAEPRLSIRGGEPVVEVRDRTLWAHDKRTRHFYAELGEDVVSQVYDEVAGSFWSDVAPALAAEMGYKGIYSEGRSAGWLRVAERQDWLAYTISDGHGEGFDMPGDCDDTDQTRAARNGLPFYVPPADDTADEDTADEYAEQRAARDRWMRFARAIHAAVIGQGVVFIEALQAEIDELNAQREACIVRGDS